MVKKHESEAKILLEEMAKFESSLVDAVIRFPRAFDVSWRLIELGLPARFLALEEALKRARRIKGTKLSYDISDGLKETMMDSAVFLLYALALIKEQEASEEAAAVDVEFVDEEEEEDGVA